MPKGFVFCKNFFKAVFKMRTYISLSLRNRLCRIKTRKNISFLLKNMNYCQSFGAMPSTSELKTVMVACPVLILSLKWQSWKHFQLKSLCWVVPHGPLHLWAYLSFSLWSQVARWIAPCGQRSQVELCMSPSMAECLSNSSLSMDVVSVPDVLLWLSQW